MSRELFIETLSIPSPKTCEELVNVIQGNFNPQEGQSLLVLPEYCLDGDNLYDGRTIDDPMVNVLLNYAKQKRAHIVSGIVELADDDNKYISGLLIGSSGIIGKRRKQTPTPFELDNGVTPGTENIQTFNLENNLGTLAIVMCFEAFELDDYIRSSVPAEVIVNPRGFDLDDPRFGLLSKKWLSHNADMAMMNKSFLVGATGSMGAPGPMAEIIDFEGDVFDFTLDCYEPLEAIADMAELRSYRRGGDDDYKSSTVPLITSKNLGQ